MIVERTERFKRDYKALRFFLRGRVDRAVILLLTRPEEPELDLTTVDPARGIRSAAVDANHRLTFEEIAGGVRLRRVGSTLRSRREP